MFDNNSAQSGLLHQLAILAIALLAASAVRAQIINVDPGVVNLNNGDGQCSLYEAAQIIIDGNNMIEPSCEMPIAGLNTINLSPDSTYMLDTDPDMDNVYMPIASFNLQGNGAMIMRAPAAPQITFILFNFATQGSINDVMLANAGPNGTAVELFTGNIVINGVEFANNGIGVRMLTTIGNQIINSTFRGSGTEVGMNITESAMQITNTSFSGLGTALELVTGDAVINNVTINNNLIGINASGGGMPMISNSIVANSANGNCAGEPLVSLDFNIDSGNTCLFSGSNDQINTDPILAGLANNGGPTQTFLPQPGSPAIDNGDNGNCPPNDQRGVFRPQDGNGDLGQECDIGSVEVMLTDADLAVSSNVIPMMANPGEMVSFTIVVDNNGPAGDMDASVVTSFPTELTNITWLCNAINGAACAPAGTGSINESVSLIDGSTVTFLVNAQIDPAATGNLMVTSTATPTGLNDPMPGNNSATSTVMVGMPNFDLEITKTDNETEVFPGDPLTYTITVNHIGDSGMNATVTDVFPAGLTNITWTCASTSKSTCPASGTGNINAPISILFGDSLTFTVNATVDPGFSGTISNTANVSVDSPDVDPNPGNNSATDMTTVTPVNADLAITKTDNLLTANPGDLLLYEITVDHAGDAPVPDATVTDTFPAGLSNVNWNCVAGAGAQCPAAGTGNISESVSLDPGSTLTFFVNAQIDQGFLGTLINTADVVVNPPDMDPNPANNSAIDTTEVVNLLVDLAIGKTVDQTTARPGDTLNYTVTAQHLAPAARDADPVPDGPVLVEALITDMLSPQLNNAAWTCASSGGAECEPAGTGSINENVLLPEGGAVVFSITGTVDQGATGEIINQASVTPVNAVDINPADNTSPLVTTLIETAFDLAISKTDGQTISSPGATLNYIITATNNGPNSLAGARITDTFAEALINPAWTCTSGRGATCGAASGNGDINEQVDFAGSSFVRFEVTASIDPDFTGTLQNTAIVSTPPGIDDPLLQNNRATDTTVVGGQADLVVSKSGPATALSGEVIVYDVMLSNLGPESATGVILTDVWSAGLNLQSVTSDVLACGERVGSMLMCQIDTLPAGASAALQFTFLVDAAMGAALTNQAMAVTSAGDPDIGNNQAGVTTMVADGIQLLPPGGALPDAFAGVEYQQGIQVAGGLDPVAVSVMGLPEGIQADIDGRSVLLGGTPVRAGLFQIQISTQDSVQPPQTAQGNYTLRVRTDLELAPPALPPANTDSFYTAVISVNNGVPPYVIEVAGLPSGINNNNGVLQGQPASTGSFNVQAEATDSQGNTGLRNYVLSVQSGLQLPGQTLPQAVLNVSYGQQLMSAGGQSPNTWTGGAGLPNGLSLSDTGFISGIPQATGQFGFNATVTDAEGAQSSGQFALEVLPEGLVQQEIRFPNGLVGWPYVTPTAVDGGSSPYTCQVVDAQLPPGLTLNGCNTGIDGTPTQGGSYGFVLAVQDNQNPPQTLLTPARIQVADSTPVAIGDPPDPGFEPPRNILVPEFGRGVPADGFNDESLQAVASDAFGNRYLAGFGWNGSDYDIRVLKYNVRGGLEWEQRFDSGNQDYAYAVTVAPLSQQLYVGGYSLQGSEYVATLLRFDLSGTLRQTIFDGIDSQVKAYYALRADSQGVYAVGERYNGSDFDALVVRYDMNGNRLFETVRDAGGSETAYAAELSACDADGVCALAFGGFEGDQNSTGWLGSIGPAGGTVQMLAQLPEPVFALAGFANGDWLAGATSNTDDWVVRRLTASGGNVWSTTITQGERLRGVAIDAGGFVMAAGSAAGAGGSDGLLSVLDGVSGQPLDSLSIDNGQRELLNGSLIGPEGLLTLIGERGNIEATRFLLVNINTGKAF